MKKLVLSLFLLASLAIAPSLAAQGIGIGTMKFDAGLLGGNGFGNVFMEIRDNDSATITSNTMGLGNITSLQLLQNGTPVLTFTDEANPFRFGRFVRTVALDPALGEDIIANPQNYSFVITTADQPLGAVRGPISDANTQVLTGTIAGVPGGALNANGSFVMTLTPRAGGEMYDVDVDMLANGLGSNVTSLILGSNTGAPVVTFGNNATIGANGRLTASTAITTAQARQILGNPGAFQVVANTPAFTGGAAVGTLAPANELFIPVVGTVTGVNGTNWKTQLNVFNTGLPFGTNGSPASAAVLMQLFPAGPTPGTLRASGVTGMTIPARGMAASNDISTNIFPGSRGLGAMRIVTAGNVFANARIFNDQSSNKLGTFGQSIPALSRSRALSSAVLLGLSNATPTSATTASSRTNVALFNPNDFETDADLELRDADGNLVASRLVHLPAMAFSQVPLTGPGGLFNTVLSDVPAGSVAFLSGAPIFVFGSVVDNVSGDATLIEPEDTSGISTE